MKERKLGRTTRPRRIFILPITLTAILFLLPFAYLLSLYARIPALADIVTQYESAGVTSSWILSGLLGGFTFFISGMVLVSLLLVGASLLFDVSWRKKQIWGEKSLLHLYCGYYLMTILLFSMFVDDLFGVSGAHWHPRLWGINGAPYLLFALLLLSLSIFVARFISKLPIKIGEATNLGYFIISIYLSYAFFKIMGHLFDLFAFWTSMLGVSDPHGAIELVPVYANAFFILSLPATFALALTVLDRIAEKSLRKHVSETL